MTGTAPAGEPDTTNLPRAHGEVTGWAAVAVLVVVGGVVPVLVAHHFGALGIPRNDDWSYLRSAFTLGESGRIDGNGWVTVSLVGQLLLALPLVWTFGSRIVPLQLEVVVLGVVGLVAVFALARVSTGSRRALFIAATVAVGPLWAPLAVSFMTDVPSFALAMVALALGVRALPPGGFRRGPFVAAVAVGVLAATIRDSAFVVVVVLVVVALWCVGGRRMDRRFVVGVGLVAVVGFLVFWRWKSGLPGFAPDAQLRPEVSDLRAAFRRSQGLLAPLGLCVAPVVVLAGPVALVRRSWARARVASAVTGAVVVLAVVEWFVATGDLMGFGNYLDRAGTLGTSLLPGTRPDLLPAALYWALGLVGLAAVVVLAVGAVAPCADGLHRLRSGRPGPPARPDFALVIVATLGFAGFTFVSRALGNAMWDRYLLPFLPLVSILVVVAGDAARRPGPVAPAVVPPDRVRRGAAVGAFVLLALSGVAYGANSASYDGTRRDVAEEAARRAGGPRRVAGGFEWDGEHAGREAYLSGTAAARACVVLRGERSAPAPGDDDVVAAAEVWAPTRSGGWIVARAAERCRDPNG